MGTLFRLTCLALLVFAAGPPRPPARRAREATPPVALRTGDVLLQASAGERARLIRRASGSPWSHVGLVEVRGGRVFVIEAVSPVSRTPLERWAARGDRGAFTVLRPRDLDGPTLDRVVATARGWVGRPYDARYRWDDEALYCSELVVKAFQRSAALTLGTRQRVRDLALTGAELELARGLGVDPDTSLVTPGSLAADPHLALVARDVLWPARRVLRNALPSPERRSSSPGIVRGP